MASNTNESRKKALIIGVSDYNILKPLAFCKNDGGEMVEVLKSREYEISETCKLIGEVESSSMRSAIYGFFRNKNIKPKDILIFYYSGHGVLDAYGDHYLAPSDIDTC